MMSCQLAPSNQLQFEVLGVHDDIIVIVVEEGECVTAKNSRQAESPACIKNRTCDINRGFVLYLW